MFCPKCGKQVDESDAFCRSCGHTLSTGVAPASDAAGPVGVGRAVEPTKRSGEATASLILGLFSFIPIAGLLAVIFGHMALASIRRSGGRLLGNGMAAFGLSLGYLGLGGWVIYGLSVLAPPFFSTRITANQISAVGSLRTLNTAEVTYATTYNTGYSATLGDLGPPAAGANPVATAAGLLDEI